MKSASIYSKLASIVREKGTLVDVVEASGGDREIYAIKDYVIILRTEPFSGKDVVIAIYHDEKPIYANKDAILEAFELLKLLETDSSPEILESVYEDLKAL